MIEPTRTQGDLMVLIRHRYLWLLLLPLLTPATAAAGSSSLQLGQVPLLPDARGIEIAIPLEVPMDRCSLETRDASLHLKRSPHVASNTWLVLSPDETGGVSGLLTLYELTGESRIVAVAGEVVATSSETLPVLLLRGNSQPQELVRYVRPRGLAPLTTESGLLEISAPDHDGWQRVMLRPLPGRTEASALASVGGYPLEIQASLLESITVRAAAQISRDFTPLGLRTLRESLEEGVLRSRLALLGRRQGLGWIRWFDVRADGREGRASVRAGRDFELLPVETGMAGRMLRLTPPQTAAAPNPTPILLRLQGEFAGLVDPVRGLLFDQRAKDMRFLGIAARSELRAGRAWALRRNLRTGATHLRRWSAVRSNGELSLRGRLAEASLEDVLQVRSLRGRALRSLVHREGWPEQGLSEELLLVAQLGRQGKAEPPVEIRALRLRAAGTPEVIGVRSLYLSELRPLPGERVGLELVPSPVVGQLGYPVRAVLRYGDLLVSEALSLNRLGDRFQGLYYLPAVSHRFQTDSYPGRFTRTLRADTDGKDTTLRMWELRSEAVPIAEGTLPGVRPLFLRSSVRGRHAYAVTSDANSLRRLRLLDVGRFLENLPPKVSLGGRLQARASSRQGVELRLRARALDANGDPLALRWSGDGVRFAEPGSPVTRALFPIGVSTVRLLARERGGAAPEFEGWDSRTVEVQAAVGINPLPGLRTELRGIFPNPANPRVRIAYTVGTPGTVRLTLHDAAGRQVRVLRNQYQGRGAYDIDWDGRDDMGHAVASGVYHLRLEELGTVDTGRVVLVR